MKFKIVNKQRRLNAIILPTHFEIDDIVENVINFVLKTKRVTLMPYLPCR